MTGSGNVRAATVTASPVRGWQLESVDTKYRLAVDTDKQYKLWHMASKKDKKI